MKDYQIGTLTFGDPRDIPKGWTKCFLVKSWFLMIKEFFLIGKMEWQSREGGETKNHFLPNYNVKKISGYEW